MDANRFTPEVEDMASTMSVKPLTVAELYGPFLTLGSKYPASPLSDPIAGSWARFCALHHNTPNTAAQYGFHYPSPRYTAFLKWWESDQSPTDKARRAVKLAKDNLSATEILNDLDMTGKGWLYRVLDFAGVEAKPYGGRARTTPQQRQQVVKLYNLGTLSYSEIGRRTEVDAVNVRNILRYAAKQGRLPEYGTRRA